MKTSRLEAFSDGVLAIIITIMVLTITTPTGASFSNLKPLIPKLLSYILSFIYVGIYWNNHHHLFHAIEKVNGGILWSNLALLFFLSLIPFATAWSGDFHTQSLPAMVYGFVLLLSATAFVILVNIAVKNEGKNSEIGKAVKGSYKEYISIVLYGIGILAALIQPIISYVIYFIVAMMWIIPDKRIEKNIHE